MEQIFESKSMDLKVFVRSQNRGIIRTYKNPNGTTDIWKDGRIIDQVKTPYSQIQEERTSLLFTPANHPQN